MSEHSLYPPFAPYFCRDQDQELVETCKQKLQAVISHKYFQSRVLITLLGAVLGAAAIVNYFNPSSFQRFLGGVNPLAAILVSGVLGLLLLSGYLSSRGFTAYDRAGLKRAFRYSGWVILFIAVAILVDVKVVYPEDMNVLFPESLLFYPVIGFFVEMLFHVLPLSVLLFCLTYLMHGIKREKLIWVCILIVALLEPTYQAVFMEGEPTWAIVVIWINLFFFNLTQLFVFKKFDFISMYLYRLFYYSIWHIVWGYFRLALLF